MYTCESYMEKLARIAAESVEKKRAENTPIEEKLQKWMAGLTDSEARQGYPMEHFVKLLNAPASKIGPLLYRLGWQRKRQWRLDAPHSRVWQLKKNNEYINS